MEVKIVNKSNNDLPIYSTEHAAGMDLRAYVSEPIVLGSLERIMVPTGLFIQLPVGYEAQIRPRSGMAIKHGISVINTPGTIDSDFSGEIKILLVNLSKDDFVINSGDRVCQMVVTNHETVNWNLVEELEKTLRGEGGFGHTGIK